MGTPRSTRAIGEHLTDIDIAKILGLAKATMSHRKIASLMKCGKSAVQHTLVTYFFETFQGAIHGKNTNGKQLNVKTDIFSVPSSKMTLFHYAILQT